MTYYIIYRKHWLHSLLISYPLRPQLVCYYTNWSQYRTKIGKFLPEDIQP